MPRICYIDGTERRRLTRTEELLERSYTAKGYPSSEAVAVAVQSNPEFGPRTTSGGLVMPLRETEIRHVFDESYDVLATWGGEKLPLGRRGYRLSTGQDTVRMTHSLATVHSIPGPGMGSAPNLRGAIGVEYSASGITVSGIEVPVPAVELAVDYAYPPNTVNLEWLKPRLAITYTVNGAPWQGFAIGEVQFLGVDTQSTTDAADLVTFMFRLSPNATNIQIGGVVVPNKRGWDVIHSLQAPDVSGTSLTSRVLGVYVERVFRYEENWSAIPNLA